MTFIQAQVLAGIDRSEWFSIDYREADPGKVPFGGTATLVNLRGDVMKVYSDGSQQIVTTEDFHALRSLKVS